MTRGIRKRQAYPFTVLALVAMVTVLVSPGLAQTCSAPSFAQPPIYAVGSGSDVRAIATADFDGDGRPDLAVADDNSSTVLVFTKVARGLPAESSTYNVGQHPLSIATGDFNGDGKQDIVTGNDSTADLSLLLNNGSGAFTSAGSFPIGGGAGAIAVGDFNNDGKLDVAVATSPSTTVLLGNGTGFGAAISVPGASSFVVTADINGDGKLDLALVTSSVEIRLGDGTGHFPTTSCGAGAGANGIALGDLNGDGRLDLVGAFVSQAKVQIMLNNGMGCFGPPASTDVLNAGRPRYVTLGDLNNDGKLDIVAGTTVLLNDGTGSFGLPVY